MVVAISILLRLSVVAVAMVVLNGQAAAQFGFRELVNPKTYSSPSGRYSLLIDPDSPDGLSSAGYRLSQDGKSVWSARLPFTLLKAGVAEDGTAGGYAYTKGGKKRFSEGVLHVVILSAAGSLRLHKQVERESSHYLHMPANPAVDGLIFDGPNDRMVLRVADPDVNRGNESWWVYSLSTGKPAGFFRPRKLMSNPTPATFIIDALAVAGTPLTLIHWWRIERWTDLGAWFTLVGSNGRPVWSLELPKDYMIPGNEDAQDKLMASIRETGAILRVDQPGRFDLRFVANRQRVTFAVTSLGSRKWRVAEVGRSAYTPESPIKEQTAAIPERTLPELKRIVLKAPLQREAPAIRGVHSFVMAGPGRIAFLRDEENGGYLLVVVDHAGILLRQVRLTGITRPQDTYLREFAWLGGERYVVSSANPSNAWESVAWWVDAAGGRVQRIPGFSSPSIEQIVPFSDGGFVVLARINQKYSSREVVQAFDSRGNKSWAVYTPDGWGNETPDKMLSPEDLAVTTDGKVLVVDKILHRVQVFDRQGKHHKTIYLKKAWGKEPEYPSDIVANANGGFIVNDYPANPPLYRMNLAGSVLGTIRPRYADGKPLDMRDEIRVASDGHVWMCDGYSLLRLSESGIVDRVLGEPPTTGAIRCVDAFTIDHAGRIYALDERTKSIHVFDAAGRWLYVCQPSKTDFDYDLMLPEISVSRTGEVFVWGASEGKTVGYLHFSAAGKRLGIHPRIEPGSASTPPPVANGVRWHGREFLDAAGRVVLEIKRRADGAWLQGVDSRSVASDGSIAILDGGTIMETGPSFVTLFTRVGTPIRTIKLPASIRQPHHVAYDGKRFVVATSKQIVCFDQMGNPLWSFAPPSAGVSGAYWHAFLTNDGCVLTLFDGIRTVYQYAMP